MALTVTAGTPATATQYNALIPKYLVQGSDQTATTTTSANHNTFVGITIGAGETWAFDVYMDVDGPTAGDVKTSWVVTGTATLDTRRHTLGMATTNTADANVQTVTGLQARSGAAVSYGTAPENGSVRGSIQEHMVFSGGASGGTITMQWAQATASGTTTMRAGSYLIGHRVI